MQSSAFPRDGSCHDTGAGQKVNGRGGRVELSPHGGTVDGSEARKAGGSYDTAGGHLLFWSIN